MTPNTLIGVIVVLAVARAIFYLVPRPDSKPSDALKWLSELSTNKTVIEYLDSIIVAGITALFLINFVVRSFYIPSGSMEHTLEINDYILVNEWVYHIYHPARGDIIVFKPPPKAEAGDKDYIKRVIAVEGDTVTMHNEIVYVNGQPTNEPYKFISKDLPGESDMPSITLAPGEVWCMGDNRHNSADSRVWGPLPIQNIIGKAAFIFYPPSRVRILH